MSDKPDDKTKQDEKPADIQIPPQTGKQFKGRGVEKRGGVK